MSTSQVVNRPEGAPFRLWESVVCWLILALATVGIIVPAYTLLSEFDYYLDALRGETMLIAGMSLPFLFFAGALLLVMRNKYSLPVFVAHLVLSLGFIAYRNGLSDLAWYGYLSWACELAIIFLAHNLFCRGALK